MRFVLCILMLAACTGCTAGGPGVEIGDKHFSVEIADSREEQTLGLMYRDSMPADHGMLFIFQDEAPRSFWMKNTRIALDILYFDQQLKLVSASLATPPCRVRRCPIYPSGVPAMYVLELNAGTAAKLGIEPGAYLQVDLD